jgi:hypothetical protein
MTIAYSQADCNQAGMTARRLGGMTAVVVIVNIQKDDAAVERHI